jgi:hypothetical protein
MIMGPALNKKQSEREGGEEKGVFPSEIKQSHNEAAHSPALTSYTSLPFMSWSIA